MKRIFYSLVVCLPLLLFIPTTSLARQSDSVALVTKTGTLQGTLVLPAMQQKVPVVLIIAGSGPTDRDGNNPMMKNNSLKMLAEALQKNGIASLRYDKRGIAGSTAAGPDEKDLRFDNYIDDAAGWIEKLKGDKRFSRVIVLGHSEGSLIGMMAADRAKADAFISIAGAGQSADKVLKEQLRSQPQPVIDLCYPIIDSLVSGKTVNDVNPMLNSLFRPSVQPYIISWFRYDPQASIKKLQMPVLLLQGTTDMQVSTKDAELLHQANPATKLVMVENMNHILKISEADRQKNFATYNDPALPLASALIDNTTGFIKGLK